MSIAQTWENIPTVTKALAIGTAALYVHAKWLSSAPEREKQDAAGSVLVFGLGAAALSLWLGHKPAHETGG